MTRRLSGKVVLSFNKRVRIMALGKLKRCDSGDKGFASLGGATEGMPTGSTPQESRERPFQVICISILAGGGAKRRSVEN